MHDLDLGVGLAQGASHVHRAADVGCGEVTRTAGLQRGHLVTQQRRRHLWLINKIRSGGTAALIISGQGNNPRSGDARKQCICMG